MKSNKRLNRNIFSMGLTSFFSDFGHEMVTAILPYFLISIGGNATLLVSYKNNSDIFPKNSMKHP